MYVISDVGPGFAFSDLPDSLVAAYVIREFVCSLRPFESLRVQSDPNWIPRFFPDLP